MKKAVFVFRCSCNTRILNDILRNSGYDLNNNLLEGLQKYLFEVVIHFLPPRLSYIMESVTIEVSQMGISQLVFYSRMLKYTQSAGSYLTIVQTPYKKVPEVLEIPVQHDLYVLTLMEKQ